MTDILDLSHWINGEKVTLDRPGESHNPSNTNEIVAREQGFAAVEFFTQQKTAYSWS